MKKMNIPTIGKRIAIAFMMLMCFTSAWCAKAYPGAVTVKQKDGTWITIVQHGDEHFSYVTTTDGVLLFQEGTDYFIARTTPDGDLLPTSCLAHNAGQRSSAELAHIARQQREVFYKAASQFQTAPRREPVGTYDDKLFPHTGSPKALIILADFIDEHFKNSDEDTKKIFDLYLNANSLYNNIDATLRRNYKSVKAYFSDMSNNQFTPVFKVEAVVHLPDSMKVYGPGRSDNMTKFIPEVCALAHEQGVDFSQFDGDDDGFVDLVYVIYAGYGQSYSGNSTDCIWPKSWYINNETTYDGKKIYRYGVHNEINYNPTITDRDPDPANNISGYSGVRQINGIGLFCHEFSHTMGLPDLYSTTSYAQNNNVPAMEYFDVMDGGEYSNSGYRPTAYTAWEREAFGWFTIDTLKTEHMGRQIKLVNIDQKGKAYRILKDGEVEDNEYHFIQNLAEYTWNVWVAKNRGKGMLVTHVDYDKYVFSLSANSVNNTVGHPRMHIVPADGVFYTSWMINNNVVTQDQYISSFAGDPFPGSGNVTEIDHFDVYRGTMNKSLLDIHHEGQNVCFYYLVTPIPLEEWFVIDTEQYTPWDIAEVATDSIVPEHISNTDDNGSTIHYASSFNELSYSFDGIKTSREKGMLINVNAKTDAVVTVEVYTQEGDETVCHTQNYTLSAGVWTPLNIDFHEIIAPNEPDNEEQFTISSVRIVTSEPMPLFYGTPLLWGSDTGISTAISHTEAIATPSRGAYTLDGRQVSHPTSTLPHGVYIINGKKIIK